MKKYLLTLGSCLFALGMSAQTPEGDEQLYDMSAYLYTNSSVYYATGIAEHIVFSNDGSSVYFSSLFPTALDNLWNVGKVDGKTITISKDDVCCKYDINGDGTQVYNLKVGELVFDESGISGVKDIVFNLDGNHIYLEDDATAPCRYLALYDTDDGKIALWYYSLCNDYKPFTGVLTTIPESAEKQDAVYTYDSDSSVPGLVAVLGNDVYFDHLNSIPGVVKGTHEGDKVTIPAGQYIGCDTGYFLYLNGGYTTGEDIEVCDIVFNITDTGLELDESQCQLTVTTTTDGSYYSTCNNVKVACEIQSGIPVILSSHVPASWYDLFGRRLTQPTRGIMIHNGKKTIK